MKKSKLIEILDDKLSNTHIVRKSEELSIFNGSAKTIYFKNKLTGRSIDFKCYSYNDKLSLEHDNCIWYFFIYEGGAGDYQEYMIPNNDAEVYIEMIIERYLDFLKKSNELKITLDKLSKLRGNNCEQEIRDYKLNKILT
jgi:hypothetical protein